MITKDEVAARLKRVLRWSAYVLAIAYLGMATAAYAGYLTLTWTATTKNTDGSPLAGPATYSPFMGATRLASGLSVLTYRVGNLKVGTTHCFTVMATVKGVNSARSNKVCKKVPQR